MPKTILFNSDNFSFVNQNIDAEEVVMVLKVVYSHLVERPIKDVPENIQELLKPFLTDIDAQNEKRKKLARNASKGGKTTQTKIKQEKQKKAAPQKRKPSALKIVFSDEINLVYEKALILFPEEVRPKTERNIFEWKNTLKILNEKHNVQLPEIYTITKQAREHQLYGPHFLSITKLLRKNNDGVLYIHIFKNLKNKTNGTKTAAPWE
jgi:hypothetical protein